MPQISYSYPSAVARAGAPGSSRAAHLARVDSRINPALFEEDTVTVGGAVSNDDAASFTVLGETVATDGNHDSAGDSLDDIADELVAKGQAVLALQSRVRFVKGGTGVVRVIAKESGLDLETAVVSQPGTVTLTVAEVTDGTANARIPAGVGVVRGSADKSIALPDNSASAADFLGVTRLSDAGLDENTGLATDEDGYSQGSVVGVQRDEDIWVEVEDAVTEGSTVFWRTTAGAGEQAGAFRSDADGGDAIELDWITYETSTSGPGLAKIKIG